MKHLSIVFVLWLVLAVCSGYGQDSIDAEALYFDQLLEKWQTLALQAQQTDEKQSSDGTGAIQEQLEELLAKIVESGLAIYRQDSQGYPRVNSTLQILAGFFVTGDPSGDGGDQYEKALPIIQALLDEGAENGVKELWLWGGVSAFCMNEFDLAEEYLQQTKRAGFLENLPAQLSSDPKILVRQRAASYLQSLPTSRKAWEKEKQLRAAEADDSPRVKFETTRGEIIIELFENEAPQTVANFLTLVKQGYYDGLTFHRVLPQFMAQGGDPTGSGSGGPGYHIRCECYGSNYRKHFRGSLSMAHAGRNTGGSQFFLTYIPTSYLDGRHTVFGRVLEGLDVASALRRRDPVAPGPKPSPDKILHAEVLRDRGHSYEFDKLPAR
ncbi:MAG: peptidylprolyl isomerase [Pirellulales bacterium]|nr:peptidylprolyl isomerase [Pirellulales bacterium]